MRSEREIGIAKIIVDHLDSQDRMLPDIVNQIT